MNQLQKKPVQITEVKQTLEPEQWEWVHDRIAEALGIQEGSRTSPRWQWKVEVLRDSWGTPGRDGHTVSFSVVGRHRDMGRLSVTAIPTQAAAEALYQRVVQSFDAGSWAKP